MGRGNLQKRAFQKEGSIKGGSRIDGETDHKVVPDYSWGTLPEHLQKRYKAYDCDSLVPPVPDALPTGPTETVRRGWNRTAGSRYEFAADGITFTGTGGI